MYIQFLVEDISTKVFLQHVMEKIRSQHPDQYLAWEIRSFKGIGHLPKHGKPLERKTGQLLNELPAALRAYNKTLLAIGQDETALFIVLDNDKRDPYIFRKQLEQVAIDQMILVDYVFCIAVKELEAWLLGDANAIEAAYPDLRKNVLRKYIQDGICDTWEVLADAVYPGGLAELKKQSGGAYMGIGKAKCQWADKIGRELELHKNESPSFQYFLREVENRVGEC